MTNHSAMLAALADPTRRVIFERLAQSPCSVGEVARELPVSRPAVSQHLKVLKSAGLVSDQAAGTRRVYSVNPAGIAAIRDYFEQFWQQSLSRFAAVASQETAATPSQEIGPTPSQQITAPSSHQRQDQTGRSQ